ncbi:MAG: hypothetical protein IKI46_03045, partial [Lachnospiraceae bacterium]|nr:hypothetical protein [Lachnospiraceae bacterium]
MGLFKTKYERELDMIITRLEMNMSNNYKDNAQMNLKELEEAFAGMKEAGQIKGASAEKYDKIIGGYIEKLKGYSHK